MNQRPQVRRIVSWTVAIVALSMSLPFAADAVGESDQSAVPWPTSGWTRSTPAEQGLSAGRLAAFGQQARSGAFGHVDRVVVVRHGRLVVDDTYVRDYQEISRGRLGPLGCGYGCTDAAWDHQFNYYHPDWHPYFQGRQVHSLQSVTKSIAATVVGVALGRGELRALDQPFLYLLTDRDVPDPDPRLRRATVADVLTMRSGIEWHEQDRPFDDTNTTLQLEKSRDWIGFTLSQPMDADPGTTWAYNSGGSMLMSAIIRSVTGRFIDDYASEYLFGPLGIEEFHWKKTPTGHPDTEGGLYLEALDLARIGYLYLRDGMWDGQRILPDGWVADATTRHTGTTSQTWDYGYQWWLTRSGGVEVWAGRGFGGQFLVVIPSRDVVGVMNGWNVFGGRTPDGLGAFMDALLANPT